jgi:hypothetical protein
LIRIPDCFGRKASKSLLGIEYLPLVTLQPTPLGLHPEAIAFFDLKSQNKNCFWLRPETFSPIAKSLVAMSGNTNILIYCRTPRLFFLFRGAGSFPMRGLFLLGRLGSSLRKNIFLRDVFRKRSIDFSNLRKLGAASSNRSSFVFFIFLRQSIFGLILN